MIQIQNIGTSNPSNPLQNIVDIELFKSNSLPILRKLPDLLDAAYANSAVERLGHEMAEMTIKADKMSRSVEDSGMAIYYARVSKFLFHAIDILISSELVLQADIDEIRVLYKDVIRAALNAGMAVEGTEIQGS